VEVLGARVLEDYYDDLIFMQDNASIHIVCVVRDWFQENGMRMG